MANDTAKFMRELTEEVADVINESTFRIHRRLITETPRDTGRASANWFLGEGVPVRRVTPPTEGKNSHADGVAERPNAVPGDTLYLSNNLPYIEALDGGHSDQAPRNFVRRGIRQEVRTINNSRKVGREF